MSIKKQGGLGKGLDALFGNTVINNLDNDEKGEKENDLHNAEGNDEGRDKVSYLKIIDVEPNRNQPRRNFEDEALQELADSIKQYGVLQPIVVNYKENYYEIVAGERRWRAAKLAGLKEIPAIIKNIDERKSKEIALIENVQREDLNAIEKARGLKALMDEYNLTQEELAKAIGKSRSGVANSLRLLNLDKRVIELLENNKISEGHCKAILAIKDLDKQYEMAMYCVETGGSVREAERKMKVNNMVSNKSKISGKYEAIYRDAEDCFRGFFGTKVKLNPKNESQGKIIIEYKTSGDLERILELIKKEN